MFAVLRNSPVRGTFQTTVWLSMKGGRFPVIDTYGGGADAVNDPAQFDDYNEVTFIYAGADSISPTGRIIVSFNSSRVSTP
jgi:hypothetical protein